MSVFKNGRSWVTHCVSGRVGQLVRVVLSAVASEHDEAHDAAQSQGQLQGGEHHVARPAHASRAALQNTSGKDLDALRRTSTEVRRRFGYKTREALGLRTWRRLFPYGSSGTAGPGPGSLHTETAWGRPHQPRGSRTCVSLWDLGSGWRPRERKRIQTQRDKTWE